MDWWAQQGIAGLLPNETQAPGPGGTTTAPTRDPRTAIQQILARYPPSSAGLEQAMPEIQRLFPGTRFDTSGGPRDEIVIPGYGLVDVLTNAEGGDPSKMAWSW